jgi:hypothetical protein
MLVDGVAPALAQMDRFTQLETIIITVIPWLARGELPVRASAQTEITAEG